MNAEFYENEATTDALFDLFIDQLHHFAELESEEDLATTGSVAQRIEQLASKQSVVGSIPT